MKNIIIFFLILFLTTSAFGQDINNDVSKRGTTAAPFLVISQGARATSMGSAFVAVADDPSALFWNVAGIARLDQNSFMVDRTEWIADLAYNYVAGSLNLGNFGSVGVSFISSDYGEMDVRTIEEPNGTGETFSVSDAAFSIAWALSLTENFSIGFNPKVVYQNIAKMSDYSFALDLGIIYNTPFQGVTLGMSISNFGSKMSLAGNTATILYDPDEGTTGNNDRIPGQLDMESWDLPLTFRVGISYEALKTESHQLRFAADALHPNNNYESVNVGGEYGFNDFLFLRGGFKSLFLDDSEESFTLGAGLKQRLMGNVSISIDYSYSDFGIFQEVQKFSLGVNF